MSKTIGQQAEIIAKGIVLAINSVPDSIDPNIAKFWAEASLNLANKGFLLIVATTAPFNEPGINSIEIPFSLPDFRMLYPQARKNTAFYIDEPFIKKIQTWYKCNNRAARDTALVAEQFYVDLLKSLQPCAILTWQSTHPTSNMLQRLARTESIPIWNAERGWLRNTIMLDLAQNTYLNEFQTSFSLARCLSLVPCSNEEYFSLRDQALSELTGRYKSNHVIDADTLRSRYGIVADARIFAFFMHGEPFLLRDANPLPAHFHGLSLSTLQEQLDVLAGYCEEKGIFLLVQDHPFNDTVGVKLKLPDSKYVVPVQENIHTILSAADRSFFTTSTIQYDAIFYGKPYGVFCRTSADIPNGAYSIFDYPSVPDFIRIVDEGSDWDERHNLLRQFIVFLSKTVLFDISTKGMSGSAEFFSKHLSKFVRPVDTNLTDRIDTFLLKWSRKA